VELRASAGRAKDGRAARRMLAIALASEGVDRKTTAESCGMDRQTQRDWVHRYSAECLVGLENRAGAWRPPRLSSAQKANPAAQAAFKKTSATRWPQRVSKRRIEHLIDGRPTPGSVRKPWRPNPSMIDRVVVTPGEDGFDIDLNGERRANLAIVDRKEELPDTKCSGSSLSLVAGQDLALTELWANST